MQTISVSSLTDEFGFRLGAGSVHTSRTMMLAELTRALDRVPAEASIQSYTAAIVDENLLGKPTRSTRLRTAKRLVELYALDPRCPIFRVFRFYWSGGGEGRPMLAFLLGCDRDAILRECTPQVLEIPRDQVVTSGHRDLARREVSGPIPTHDPALDSSEPRLHLVTSRHIAGNYLQTSGSTC